MSTIRKNIGKWLLMRSSHSSKSELLKTMSQAMWIGILYDVDSITDKELNKAVHYFESEGKRVKTLGFINAKELKDEHSLKDRGSFFTRKELNFWGIPHGSLIDEFVAEDFDFLINLDSKGQLPLQAISAKSKAKIRMAKHDEEFMFAHDFMARTATQNGGELFNELKKYIRNDG